MTEWLLVLAAVALTAGTALFVTAEFSLVALDRPSVQQAVDNGDEGAATVLRSLRQLSTQLSAAQVGITLTTLIVGYLAEPSIGSLLYGPLQSLGLSESMAASVATALALILVTLFSMVFGELMSQFLGISAPLAAAKVVAGPVRAFALVARPLVAILNGSANAALRAMGITPQEELTSARTPQELASLVRRSAEQGTIEANTARLLTRSLDFGDRTASDVMTPRVRCSGIERTARADDIIRLARQTGHSRFPVIGDDWDDIDGLVHVKKAIAVPHDRRPDVPVSALMVAPVMVPETIRLDPLLLQLRAAGLQMVVVVDEYGGTSGVVTLEDVVEEIVGEVSDEHDRSRVGLEPDGRRVLAAARPLATGPGARPAGRRAAGRADLRDRRRVRHGGAGPDPGRRRRADAAGLGRPGRPDGRAPGRPVAVHPGSRGAGRRRGRLARRRGLRVSHTLALWISVLLLLGNAFFVGAEFAAMAARRSTLEPMAAAGSARARMALDALEHLGSMLATAQLGITICSVGLGALAEAALHEMLEDVFHAWHLDQWVSDAWLGPISLFVALNIVVYFHVVIGEMIPKNLAIAGPDRAALLLVPALLFVSRALRPLVRVMESIAKGLVRLVFRVEPKDEITSAFTADEVAHIVAESHAEGLLEEEREGLVRSALDFSDKVASAGGGPGRPAGHRVDGRDARGHRAARRPLRVLAVPRADGRR